LKHPLFQHKRKDLSEEEYLVEEQPSKKAKKSKLVEAPEEGGFDLLSVEEEIEESDQARVLGKRTREGQEDAPSPVQAPRLPKEPRKKAIRKLKYTSEAEEKEIGEMVDEVTNQTTKELVNEVMDCVRKEALDKETAIAAAAKVINVSREVQELATSEAENLVMRTASEVRASEQPASEEQPTSEGNSLPQSTVAEIVTLSSSSDSASSSSSSEHSSSSSTDSDDIPLSRAIPSLRNLTPSPSTKLHKEPATDAFIPVYDSIEARTIVLQQTRIGKCKNLPENNPLQPPVTEAIQSLPASAEGASDLSGTGLDILNQSVSTPNSPTPTPNTLNNNQTLEQSVISNLESHYSGELPGYQKQMTSDITSDEVVMTESPPQQQPNQIRDHINPSYSILHTKITEPEPETSVDPEHSAIDQNESDQTTFDQNPSSSNLSIEPIEASSSDIPKPPSVFLNFPFLATVCLDIFKKAKMLIETRHNLVHNEDYEKQWKRVVERVHLVFFEIQRSSLDDQAQAQKELKD